MNKFQEINTLRKEGKLEEAWLKASEYVSVCPDDAWIKRAMGWVIYDYMNICVSSKDFAKFLDWLEKIAALKVDKDDIMLLDHVLWSVRKILVESVGSDSQYDNLFTLLQTIPFAQNGKPYSALLSAVIKLDGKWKNLPSFLEWWDLKNLTSEDYTCAKLDNGKKMMSLAERAVICYSKNLLKNGSMEKMDTFLPFLKSVVEEHKEMLYPPYYLAKLLLKKGDTISAWNLLKEFAKCKAKDFWVWQLLADTQSEDATKLAFLCKALSCGGKEEMLVSLREDAAILFAKSGYHKEAKHEAEKAISTRLSNGWCITAGLQNIQMSSWFAQSESSASNALFYKQHSGKAESMIFGEEHTYTCLVTYVNEVKQMVSFVTEDKRQGFFKVPNGARGIKRDSLVSFSAKDILEDKPTVVRNVQAVDGNNNPAFFKQFSGSLQIKGSFGMVGNVFVEPSIIGNLQHGSTVKGIACISLDKKKNKWGWRAILIER